jgi:hypothetical protein
MDFNELFHENGRIRFDVFIDNYKDYVKRRSFKYFREKDKETGQYKSLKEAAAAYSFETYIQAFIQTLEGKSYIDPHTGLGRCDMIINIKDHEYVLEFKIFRDILRFEKGKKQVAYYAKTLNISEGIYLVFVPNTVTLDGLEETLEHIDNIEVRTYIVRYDEEKDF